MNFRPLSGVIILIVKPHAFGLAAVHTIKNKADARIGRSDLLDKRFCFGRRRAD